MVHEGEQSRRIAEAREAAKLSQRQLATRSGIAQATLSRIEQGTRAAKMNEIVILADVLGCTISELTGLSSVQERLQCVARATDDADMKTMYSELSHYLELDAYLEDQGISPQI
ncbi:helix-turn-helix transcriptional regulator [Kribbella qitaiheensis]|uniref:Helix-turn-helix transcriptional regulator n=1 Tax=Kribbella qitaiheensis TaxID=1544730 RepID=A0A7G6WYS9_9ACTN|nr:helix-turn-helix transcriptional regulator [Kribbella qitaiheensis]QNE19144.1 helix-turn-helix transcriptional regulator [Kribbella qitaiheensis]